MRLLELALDGARREGHAARQGLIHGQRAAIPLARGSLHDAQVEAETGLRIVDERHFAFPQLLSVAIAVHIERNELAAAEALVERGGTLDLGLDRIYLDNYLTARGRLRIAQGRTREGASDLLWCGQRLEAHGDPLAVGLEAASRDAPSHRWASTSRQRRSPSEHLALARRVGAPGALGARCVRWPRRAGTATPWRC